MTNAGRHEDPVEDYVMTLTATLRGPVRAKTRMIEEIRNGLTDAVAARIVDGLSYEDAARREVQAFGTPDQMAPTCQQELTMRQIRRTAWAVALAVPILIAYWHLIWTADPSQGHPLPRPAQLVTVHLAGVAATAALLSAVTLLATGRLGRWLPTPRRLPLVVAWTAATGTASMAIAPLALAAASAQTIGWSPVTITAALSALPLSAIAASARACRRCAGS